MANVKVACPQCQFFEVITEGDARTADPSWTPFCPNDRTPMVIVSTPADPDPTIAPSADGLSLAQQVEKIRELEAEAEANEREWSKAAEFAKKRRRAADESIARLRSFIQKLQTPTLLPLFDEQAGGREVIAEAVLDPPPDTEPAVAPAP